MPTDVLDPPITDGHGYYVRARDLRFLRIDDDDVGRWHAKAVPLGMSEIQYRGFVVALRSALEHDGIDVSTCDIRLKGSSATFFSGAHKTFPRSRDEIIDLFLEVRERCPEGWEIDEVLDRLGRQWIIDGVLPVRRPFDSLFRLGIDRSPSDIDLQISDDRFVRRCEALLAIRGQDPSEARLNHPTYAFVKKPLIRETFPNLYLFSLRIGDALGRDVNIAVFPSCGPGDTSATHGPLSAHHRCEDWSVDT